MFEGYPAFAYNTFEFAIVVLDNQTGKNPSFDPLVSNTIAKIVFDFFQNHERIILYTCDTSDGRGEARQRKFNLWFDYYKGVNYWKFDTTFEDPSGDIYYTSLIFKSDNPHRLQIIEAFDRLSSGYDDK